MPYREIPMDSYLRKDHFSYFTQLAYPYVGLTAEVDITQFLPWCRQRKLPFFLTVCHCCAQAANRVPEFRQRILDGKIIEFDRCTTSHTVALEDGTYCYCTLSHEMPFPEYLRYAQQEQEKARMRGTIQESDSASLDKLFISTLPWISYTALVQPVPMPADSNPRITWGKYREQDGKILLPLSVLCNHALVDGQHIARFYQALEEALQALMADSSL